MDVASAPDPSQQHQLPPSVVRDPSLAAAGQRKLDWVAQRMPVVNAVTEQLAAQGTLAGQRVSICLHLEAKTAYWAYRLQQAGAQVAICGSNPLSTQDDVCAALAAAGVGVYAWHDASADEYRNFIRQSVAHNPTLIVDDGGDLVNVLHNEEKERLPHLLGGSEETTTGVLRLRAMAQAGALQFPMLAANDARAKFLFDNQHGTGQSVWDGIMRTTNLLLAGKVAVVMGYGWCGKGIANRAAGLGAHVIVCEVNPVRANEALMDGHRVMNSLDAAARGDFFVTATGCIDVLRAQHFALMKDGALLANAGHFNTEINITELAAGAIGNKVVRPNVREFQMADGRSLYLLAEGRLVNIAAGDGHPAEIMDMSFAIQSLALGHLVQHHQQLSPGVWDLPASFDEQVCNLRLQALGLAIDQLTEKQKAYLASWQ